MSYCLTTTTCFSFIGDLSSLVAGDGLEFRGLHDAKHPVFVRHSLHRSPSIVVVTAVSTRFITNRTVLILPNSASQLILCILYLFLR
jgi:hypothetical protein